MARSLPKNEKELAIYREMSKINQGWLVLRVILGVSIALTIAVLYATFRNGNFHLAAINALLDGLFGWCLKIIVRFHFPAAEKGIIPQLKEKLLGEGTDD